MELMHIHIDLPWCYQIVFGMVDVECDNHFKLCTSPVVNPYKLYKLSGTNTTSHFLVCCVINVWNSLPKTMDFSTINAVRRAISDADLAEFLVLTQYTDT